jgi:hypothetical protein
MSIPPIDPSSTWTADKVKYALNPSDYDLLITKVLPKEVTGAQSTLAAIPKLQAQLAEQQATSDAVENLFFALGQYIGGLEQEAEGLNGRVVVPITPTDIDDGKTGTGVLFTPPPPKPDPATDPVEYTGPLRKTNLFGGTLAGADNETDGLADELPYLSIAVPTPADNTAWQAALTEEATGLAKQAAGLAIVAAAPWNLPVGTEQAQVAAAQAAVAFHQTLNLLTMTGVQKTARIAAIGVRQGEVAARVTVNDTQRNAEYEMRFQILDSLLNTPHGFGRFEAVTQKVLAYVTEHKDFYVNFDKIYSAVIG